MRYDEGVNCIETDDIDKAMTYAKMLLSDDKEIIITFDGLYYIVRHVPADRDLGLPFPVFVDENEWESLLDMRSEERERLAREILGLRRDENAES